MKTIALITAVLFAFPAWSAAQEDDMYFVPKKGKAKSAETRKAEPATPHKPVYVITYEDVAGETSGSERDVDEYNRRYTLSGTYADRDTVYIDDCDDGEEEDGRWVNGFNGTEEDYAYASRILRFRSPTAGIPVSSRLYWDLCHGPNSIYWNVYDDGLYAYAFPTIWNYGYGYPYPYDWYYGYPYRYSFSFGWGWGWGPHWGYDPWFHHHHHHRPPLAGGVHHRPYYPRVGANGAWYPGRGGQNAAAGRRPVHAGSRRPVTSRPGKGEGTSVRQRPAQSRPSRSTQNSSKVRPVPQQKDGVSRPSRSYSPPANGGGSDRTGGSVSRPSRSGGGGGISTPRGGGGSRPRR